MAKCWCGHPLDVPHSHRGDEPVVLPSSGEPFPGFTRPVVTPIGNLHDRLAEVRVPFGVGSPELAAAAGAPSTARTDTSNRFTVARQRDAVLIMTPPRPADRLTREQALTFAAWLIAMASTPLERPLERVAAIIDEIRT